MSVICYSQERQRKALPVWWGWGSQFSGRSDSAGPLKSERVWTQAEASLWGGCRHGLCFTSLFPRVGVFTLETSVSFYLSSTEFKGEWQLWVPRPPKWHEHFSSENKRKAFIELQHCKTETSLIGSLSLLSPQVAPFSRLSLSSVLLFCCPHTASSQRRFQTSKTSPLQALSSSCPVPGAGGQSREGIVVLLQGSGISQPSTEWGPMVLPVQCGSNKSVSCECRRLMPRGL